MIKGIAGRAARPGTAALSGLFERTSGATRIVLFTGLLGATAAILAVLIVPAQAPARPPFTLQWWLLAAFFYLAEAKVIHLHIGRSVHSFSMSEIPVVVGLFLVAPPEFVAARIIGSALALFISRRQRGAKLAFNVAQFGLCAVVSVAIVHLAASPTGELGPPLWIAALVTTLIDNLIGVLCVSTAISLAEGTPHYRRLPEMLRIGTIVSTTNASLALMGLTVVWEQTSAAWLLVVPTVTASLAYRAYISERQRHEALEMLHESTLILQRSPHLDAALVSLLDHARKMFRASVAEISLLPVRNQSVANGIPYWGSFPNESQIHVALEIPLLTASVKTLVSQPSFSFARFQRTQSIGLPVRLDDELRGFIRRVFRQFCEIETRRMCGDVRGHWSSNP